MPVLNPNPNNWRDLGPELIWVTGPVPFVKFKLYTNPDPYPYKRPRVKPKLNPNTQPLVYYIQDTSNTKTLIEILMISLKKCKLFENLMENRQKWRSRIM